MNILKRLNQELQLRCSAYNLVIQKYARKLEMKKRNNGAKKGKNPKKKKISTPVLRLWRVM